MSPPNLLFLLISYWSFGYLGQVTDAALKPLLSSCKFPPSCHLGTIHMLKNIEYWQTSYLSRFPGIICDIKNQSYSLFDNDWLTNAFKNNAFGKYCLVYKYNLYLLTLLRLPKSRKLLLTQANLESNLRFLFYPRSSSVYLQVANAKGIDIESILK